MQASTGLAGAALAHARETAAAQIEETRRALDQAAKSQRAWIVPDEWLSASKRVTSTEAPNEIRFRPIADEGSWILVRFRNIGRVPAFDARAIAKPIRTRRYTSSTVSNTEATGAVRRVFSVDDKGDNNCAFYLHVGNQYDIDGIASGEVDLTVRVELTYRDPIGTEGLTAFTMTYGEAGFFTLSGTIHTGDSVMR